MKLFNLAFVAMLFCSCSKGGIYVETGDHALLSRIKRCLEDNGVSYSLSDGQANSIWVDLSAGALEEIIGPLGHFGEPDKSRCIAQ